MEFLTYIFGETGLMNSFFGGYYFIIPLFFFGLFLLYLYVNRVSSDNIMLFLFTGILLITIDDLFSVPIEYTIGIIILILFIIGTYAYTYINR